MTFNLYLDKKPSQKKQSLINYLIKFNFKMNY